MKRLFAWILVAALIAGFAGCAANRDDRVNPISFFYKNREVSFGSEYGVIYPLAVDLDDRGIAISELISRYLEGPDEEFLECPFPPGTVLTECTWIDGLLTIVLSDEFQTLSVLDTTVAMACLTMTMTQVEGVDAVLIQTADGAFSYQDEPLTAEDFSFLIESDETEEMTFNLYFADTANRYLLIDIRTMRVEDRESLPMMVLNALFEGPSNSNLLSVLPMETRVQDVQIHDNVCVVDLSSAFLENRPRTAQEERLVIFSIVNALTELDGIESVRFQVEGQRIGRYLNLDLSEPISRDETAIGPIRSSLNEFDATIYLYSKGSELLVGLPMRLRSSASQTVAETTLRELLEAKPQAGLTNPIPEGTKINSVAVTNSLCSVDFSKEFLNAGSSLISEQNAVRAVVATLCRLSGVRRVQITIDGKAEGLIYHDISKPLTSQPSWSAD